MSRVRGKYPPSDPKEIFSFFFLLPLQTDFLRALRMSSFPLGFLFVNLSRADIGWLDFCTIPFFSRGPYEEIFSLFTGRALQKTCAFLRRRRPTHHARSCFSHTQAPSVPFPSDGILWWTLPFFWVQFNSRPSGLFFCRIPLPRTGKLFQV